MEPEVQCRIHKGSLLVNNFMDLWKNNFYFYVHVVSTFFDLQLSPLLSISIFVSQFVKETSLFSYYLHLQLAYPPRRILFRSIFFSPIG